MSGLGDEPENQGISTPAGITETALRIYKEQYQDDFEREHKGHYAVIDVTSGKAYVDESSGAALQKARQEAPYGVFHLFRIGTASAFTTTQSERPQDGWLWGI